MTADTFCTGYVTPTEGELTTCNETIPLRVSLGQDRTLTLQGGKPYDYWHGWVNAARDTWELGNRTLGTFGGSVRWDKDARRYELTGGSTHIPPFLRIGDEVLPQEMVK